MANGRLHADRVAPRSRARLGEILLATGSVTSETLAVALVEQRRTGRPLGEILVAHGVSLGAVTKGLLRQLRDDLPSGRLGDILVEQGLVTRAQIGKALHSRVAHGKRLGEALIADGAISRHELDAALEHQAREGR